MSKLFRAALRTYRSHLGLIILGATLALLPAALLQGVLASAVDDASDEHPIAIAAVTLAAVGSGAFGYFFLSGMLAQLTVVQAAGDPRPGLLEVARAVPYRDLIVVDLIVTTGTAIGLELLVIPGIVFASMYALAPALIETRHLGPRAAMRRSAELVRGDFWWVVLVLTVAFGGVYALAIPIELAVDSLIPLADEIDEIIAALLAGVTVKPLAALVLVELALDLDSRAEATAAG